MAMTQIEKRYVNRQKKADRNIENIRQSLSLLNLDNVHDTLEIGCGIGAVSAYLAGPCILNVTGVDIDPDQIEIARKLYSQGERLRYLVEDAANFSFEDNSFDLVVSQNAFHHIADWRKAVREVARVLRPRGYFIWQDLAFPELIKKIFQPVVNRYGLYTIDEIKLEFANNNFDTIDKDRLLHGLFVHQKLVLQKR
jgi:ubiquinone/menaquinone biosynthesis C-methylase UbiE